MPGLVAQYQISHYHMITILVKKKLVYIRSNLVFLTRYNKDLIQKSSSKRPRGPNSKKGAWAPGWHREENEFRPGDQWRPAIKGDAAAEAAAFG